MVPRDVRVQLNEQLVELANSYYQHYGSKHDALSALGEDLLRLADQGVHDGSSSWIAFYVAVVVKSPLVISHGNADNPIYRHCLLKRYRIFP